MKRNRAKVSVLITARFVSFDHVLSTGMRMPVTIIHVPRKKRRKPTNIQRIK